MFAKTLHSIESNSIVDLTQSFKSFDLEFKTKEHFEYKKEEFKVKKGMINNKFINSLKLKISTVRHGNKLPNYLFKFIDIENLEDFARHLVKVDELRNYSARAFINGKKEEFENKKRKFKEDIEKELKYFEKIMLKM